MISPEASAALDRLDALSGGGIKNRITSAYRSPEHNKRVGGAKHSQHMHGNAFDVDVSDMSTPERQRLIQQAREAGFRGIGVYNNALHFDVGPERAWGPSYSRDSLPEWYSAPTDNTAPGSFTQNPDDRQNRLREFNMLASLMPKWRNSLRG